MTEVDPLKDYKEHGHARSYEIGDLLDERVEEDKRAFFDSIKASFGLPYFAVQEDGLFEEKHRVLRSHGDRLFAPAPIEYLDELWLKDVQIVATVMRSAGRSGINHVTFASTGILPENLRTLYEIYNVDRAISDLPSLPLPPKQPSRYL